MTGKWRKGNTVVPRTDKRLRLSGIKKKFTVVGSDDEPSYLCRSIKIFIYDNYVFLIILFKYKTTGTVPKDFLLQKSRLFSVGLSGYHRWIRF